VKWGRTPRLSLIGRAKMRLYRLRREAWRRCPEFMLALEDSKSSKGCHGKRRKKTDGAMY